MRIAILLIATALVLASGTRLVQAQVWEESPYIYLIAASDCQHEPYSRTLTGFRIKSMQGIVTALHGVADCTRIEADSSASGTTRLHGLEVAQVDVARDVALLHAPQPDLLPDTQGLDALPVTDTVVAMAVAYVVGHPYGLIEQKATYDLRILDPHKQLRTLVPAGEVFDSLDQRNSPSVDIYVLDIQGTLVPGHSGAPLFNSHNQVIGVGSGGLQGGATEFVWAIPWHEIAWQAVETSALASVQGNNPAEIFAFPQDASLPVPSGQLRLQVRVGEGANSHTIEQLVSTTEPATYLLTTPAEIDLTDAAITILSLDAESGNSRVLATGQVNDTIESKGTCGTNYRFEVEVQAGALLLSVAPAFPVPAPGTSLVMRGCVYDATTKAPVDGATVTVGVYKFGVFIELAREQSDSEGQYVLPGITADANNELGLIMIAMEGYDPYSRQLQISNSQLTDIFLTASVTPTPTTAPSLPTETSTTSPGSLQIALELPREPGVFVVRGTAVDQYNLGDKLVVYEPLTPEHEHPVALLHVVSKSDQTLIAQATLIYADTEILPGWRVDDRVDMLSASTLVPFADYAIGYLLEPGRVRLRPGSGVSEGTLLEALELYIDNGRIIDALPYDPPLVMQVTTIGGTGIVARVTLDEGEWPSSGTLVKLASEPESSATPAATPTQVPIGGEFHVVVAQIGDLDSQGNITSSSLGKEISHWLAGSLEEQLANEDFPVDPEEVKVWEDNRSPIPELPIGVIDKTNVYTLASAIDTRASSPLPVILVIYGYLDGQSEETQLHLYFYYSDPSVSMLPDIQVGLQPFGDAIRIPYDDGARLRAWLNSAGALKERTTLLFWLVNALTYVGIGQPAEALDLFKAAEELLEIGQWQHPDVSSLLYFFMGQTALQVPELAEARRAFEQIIDHDQDQIDTPYTRVARIGLGNYYYLRAQLFFSGLEHASQVNSNMETCITEFSGTDPNRIAANSSEIAANLEEVFTALDEAKGHYRDAMQWVGAPDPRMEYVNEVARVTLANAYRLAAEGYLYQLGQPDTEVEAQTALFGTARQELNTAEEQYHQVLNHYEQGLSLSEQMEQFGLLSYALYGLGLTQIAQADIDRYYLEDPEKAEEVYRRASHYLDWCMQLSPQDNRNESLQERMHCFCQEKKNEVERNLNELQEMKEGVG